MSNLINSIRDYILTCPFLSEWRVNVDYLGAGMEYSIESSSVRSCDPEVYGWRSKETVPVCVYQQRRI